MTKWRLRRPALPTVVLTALACTAVLSGCGVHPDVDHQVARAAPAPLLDVGPEPGPPEQVWQAEIEAAGSEQAAYRLVGGNLVVLTKTGLAAYDATTGDPAWSYREPGRQIWGVAETGGAIVLNTYKKKEKDGSDYTADKYLVGLDSGTGKRLWEKSEDWYITAAGESRSGTPPAWGDAADGTVVVQPDSPSERIGLDARTGEQRWRIDDRDVVGDCAEPKPSKPGSGPLVLAKFGCGATGGSMSVALDAGSGEARWHRPSPGDVTLHGEIGLFSRFDAPPVLVGPDGEELFSAPRGGSCPCELYANGTGVLLVYRSEAREGRALITVDPATRAAKPLRAWTGTERSGLSAAAGGRFYDVSSSLLPRDLDRLRAGLRLAGLTVTDVRSGTVRSVPLLAAGPLRTAANRAEQGRWLGAGGGRLFLATQERSGPNSFEPPVVTSFAVRDPKQPLELGGVPPESWPAPCRLLAGIPNDPDRRAPLGPPEADAPLTVGGTRIPATSCTSAVASQDEAERIVVARVRVLWVAATEQEAAALFGKERSTLHGANQERRPESGDGLVVRVGRTILSIQASGSGEHQDAVYRKVIENLRALG